MRENTTPQHSHSVILCSSSPIFTCGCSFHSVKMFLMTPSSCCILHRYPCPFYRVWNGSCGLFLLILAPCPLSHALSPWSTHTYPLAWFKYLLQKTLAQPSGWPECWHISVLASCSKRIKLWATAAAPCSTPSEKWKSEVGILFSRKKLAEAVLR